MVFSRIHLNRHTPLTTTLTMHAYSVVPKLCQMLNTWVILTPPHTSNCRSQDTARAYQQTPRRPLETMRTSSLLCKISIFNHYYLLTKLLLWKVKPGQFKTHCKGSAWQDITSHLELWQSTLWELWLLDTITYKFKVACLVHQSLSRQVPLYLADDCCLVFDSRQRSLWSADIPTCVVLWTQSSYNDRTFAAAGTCLWDSLPVNCTIQTSPTDCSDDS